MTQVWKQTKQKNKTYKVKGNWIWLEYRVFREIRERSSMTHRWKNYVLIHSRFLKGNLKPLKQRHNQICTFECLHTRAWPERKNIQSEATWELLQQMSKGISAKQWLSMTF